MAKVKKSIYPIVTGWIASDFYVKESQGEKPPFDIFLKNNKLMQRSKPKTDPIVDKVIEIFKERSKGGIVKYGTTLEENNTDDFIKHMQEELMDAILYLEKIKSIKAMSNG
jgi:hypothetical protein